MGLKHLFQFTELRTLLSHLKGDRGPEPHEAAQRHGGTQVRVVQNAQLLAELRNTIQRESGPGPAVAPQRE